jgi:hypothetical protein
VSAIAEHHSYAPFPFSTCESSMFISFQSTGFVRFVHPKSVERAFDRFRVSEIEVQDVSVMMKPLKPELEL